MTKKDFFNTLTNGLKDLPPDKVSDILFDYQDYFISKKDTLSEEELISSLGSIDDIISHYHEEYYQTAEDFTDEFPAITQEHIDNFNKNSNINNSKEQIKYDKPEDSSSKSNKAKVFSNNHKSKGKTTNKSKTEKSENHSTNNIPYEKGISKKKTFLGYLFSLPLLAITLPIGFALGLASFSVYIAFILLAFSIGLTIFCISLVPLGVGFAGLITMVAKSFGTMFFTNIPKFILDFPSAFIVLLSISLIFLSIGIFSLGVSYFKSTKKSILSISSKMLNIVFKRGENYNEA
ncbi:DUF1700 domain-containing protein [uncultured Clostridium sp.]|uniref:DUF1700 domain-containing protein n=1 Tax=uncultured Clostridium sp. TaxID=59620 RepID=UPI0026185D2F|nr:DUF1700 domain-containing protein [uncultured Clostridium sp.]